MHYKDIVHEGVTKELNKFIKNDIRIAAENALLKNTINLDKIIDILKNNYSNNYFVLKNK